MAVGEGKFVLYSRVTPPLLAGDYRLTAQQSLEGSTQGEALDPDALPVADLKTHFRVRSPRFALPPDQVLSTFPPANAEGSFGARLPQIVIKRRTLPWERSVGPGGSEETPWLALVLIAEGEAELRLNRPVAECVTPGVHFDGVADAALGNYLLVRRSVVDRVFPTRRDVTLLAHAREVDIHDTELMMGDDDGFLAVVVANRLPLSATGPDGEDAPVKYLACLVNLEQQFDVLREEAPPSVGLSALPVRTTAVLMAAAERDHATMQLTPASAGSRPSEGVRHAAAPARSEVAGQWGRGSGVAPTGADLYAEMARPFGFLDPRIPDGRLPQGTFRFPVLLHWSFTSRGQTTFRRLMNDLDGALLGTVGEGAPEGRAAPEVVETGHVGLAHRTRIGDVVRAWYRGPLVPHPTIDPPEGRLALAHASDQLRIVVPDGREDLSLASAFEIGRLLALARPSMVAALLRWRQLHYQAARHEAIWSAQQAFLTLLGLDTGRVRHDFGARLGRGLARAIAARPEEFLGNPRPLVSPGRPLPLAGDAALHLEAGLALPTRALRGTPSAVLQRLRAEEVPVERATGIIIQRGTPSGEATRLGREAMDRQLDQQLVQLLHGLDSLVEPRE